MFVTGELKSVITSFRKCELKYPIFWDFKSLQIPIRVPVYSSFYVKLGYRVTIIQGNDGWYEIRFVVDFQLKRVAT